MTEMEELTYLVDWFKEDSGTYRNMPTAVNRDDLRIQLRSMMNVRPPRPVPQEVLDVQDAYLKRRNQEKGIVALKQIPASPSDSRLSLWQGDITRLGVDAIVNAANSQMLGCFVPLHNCIDNCIHSFAGVQLRLACDAQMQAFRNQYGEEYEQPTATPMITKGYNLPAKYVIHVVGPIVSGDLNQRHKDELAQCYTRSLDLAAKHGCASIAFCCISTGVFMFPADKAAEIAVRTVKNWLDAHPDSCLKRVIFNVFKDSDRMLYEQLLSESPSS